MAPRPTMSTLIAEVASLVYDPTFAVLTTDQVQTALDRHQRAERYLPLTARPTQGGAATQYLIYEAPVGHWETDATLWSGAYAALTPVTSDYLTGRWTFAVSTPQPVLLIGQSYDVYAAAADLCILRAAWTSDQYNMSDQGQSLQRGSVPVNWRALAKDYRALRRMWAA